MSSSSRFTVSASRSRSSAMAPPAVPSSGKPDVDTRGRTRPHVVFVPSAGMGHLLPFIRFIAALSTHDAVDISVVTVLPTVSAAEADHLAALFDDFPAIRRIDFHLLPLDAASEFPGADPFLLRWEALRRSMHLLGPVIAGVTPRATAVVSDVTLVSHVNPIAKDMGLQCHVLFVSSATMMSLGSYFPVYLDARHAGVGVGDVDIPGVRRIKRSWLPQPLLDLNKLFTKQFIENGREIVKTHGVLINTFDALEPAALAALRDGKVVDGFPPVFAVGPYSSLAASETRKVAATEADDDGGSPPMAWLHQQPVRSVVYVAFGNRNAVSHDQLREIAAGLEASGCRFLWVVKTTVVDRDDDAGVRDVLGDGFMDLVDQGRGMVTKDWVDQEAVLRHPAVGLFLSHSGWNSVTEAAAAGVPLLAWPRGGDHRVAATVVASGGVGVWMEGWSWDGEEWLVSGEEIGEKVKEMMADAAVRERSAKVGEEAAKAVAVGGTSHTSMLEFVAKLNAT